MRVSDAHLDALRTEGFTVVEGFLAPDELARARDALWAIYPRPEAYFADPAAHAAFGRDQFAGIRYFPYPSWDLNALAVHPDLIDAAERFLGATELDLYKIELWAKYAGAVDYDQAHHRDYGNHTLLVPERERPQMTSFILLSDVTLADGPTKVVPLRYTGAMPTTPFHRPMGELFEREVAVTAPAGSLMIYRTDVFHRGSNFTQAGRSRFALLVDFKARGAPWQGKMAWPDRANRPAWPEAMARMTPRQRDLFGFPPLGHPYWTPQTVREVGARYPAMDMAPYAQASQPD